MRSRPSTSSLRAAWRLKLFAKPRAEVTVDVGSEFIATREPLL
jgi:hypothetical protein